ncbi:UNVERIFIED_CONTAM: hypothetical protein HDU68_005092 [Siphonaria sp. JEL0065]|nr:hypothetical protein HDU68_005092 [Siphonaria sp. JEL0065]
MNILETLLSLAHEHLGAIAVMAASGAILYFIHSVYIYPFYLSPIRELPGPLVKNRLNLLGHMAAKSLELGSGDPGSAYLTWSQTYGYISKHYRLFNEPCVTLCSPRGIKRVMGTHSHLYARSSMSYRLVKSWFGPGLVMVDGDIHKRQRAICNPAFTQKNLIRYIPTFLASARELKNSWLESTSETDFTKLDIGQEMAKPTLDIIGRCGFSYEFNSVANGVTDMYSLIQDLNCMFEFKHAITDELFPFSKWIIPSVWRRHAKANDAKKRFRQMGLELIAQRKSELEQEQKGNEMENDKVEDLLTLLLRANMDAEAKRRLDLDELLAQILVFVFAGHETSATSLAFVFLFF